jgi:DEAD/DEAH box helicase domain-containing protein
VIAEVAFTAALTTLHEKAIYLHEARQFQVEKLDYEGRKAYVRRVDSDYFTDAIDYTQVKELEEFESEDVNGARAAHGDVRVNTQVVGFKKLRFYSMENIGAGNLSMPEQELHTTAFWLHFPASFWARLPDMAPAERQSGLTGLAQVMRTVAALLLMCDPRDLGIAISEDISRATQSFEPDLFLFDNYPGGIGQSQPLFQLTGKLLGGALEVLVGCGCETGCPACVGPVGEVGESGKQATSRLLLELLAVQRTNS